MKEEGLLYDPRSGIFFHIYSDAGKLIIDRQFCQHEHSRPIIVVAE